MSPTTNPTADLPRPPEKEDVSSEAASSGLPPRIERSGVAQMLQELRVSSVLVGIFGIDLGGPERLQYPIIGACGL